MGGGIELQANNQVQSLAQNPELPVEADVVLIEFPTEAVGSENGAIFFNLDWQNRQAEGLRQRLTTTFGTASAEQNPAENLTDSAWTDFVDLAKQHEDFAEFRSQPEKFWQQVRQMSETRIVRDDSGNETRTTSRFDELVSDMQAKKLSPSEFAETLPPNERAAFKASIQLEKTFGANFYIEDGATVNETPETRFSEVAVDTNHIADSGEGRTAPRFLSSGNTAAATFGEPQFIAKSLPLPVTNVVAAALENPKMITSGNTSMPNTAPIVVSQTALNTTAVASPIISESFAARALSNVAPENTAHNGAAALRDGGTVIGGALISGAFAAIDNYKNTENKEVGDSRTGGSVYDGSAIGLAAGAAGALFGAAVGKAIPGAGTSVSGVLGFVSSIVVGADVNQGLRWLSAGLMAFGGTDGATNAIEEKQLTAGNTLITDLTFQPAYSLK